ncbi:MAG TPA: elongation factor G [Kofleriaceae bacterium]|nr:elongation factor G [Kofleriaceae bacterium]
MSTLSKLSKLATLATVRNIGIIAHVDAGKTTLTERLLKITGKIRSIGEVHDGNATTDDHPIEKRRGITILAAAVSCDWRDHTINIIDTPGHVDFNLEVERSLRVLDSAVVVLDGVAGVEAQTETVWRQAARFGVPRLCVVNKLDRVGANFDRCVAELQTRLAANPAVIAYPIVDNDGAMIGLVDLIEQRALYWDDPMQPTEPRWAQVPAALFDNTHSLREQLIAACADVDDDLLSLVIADQTPTAAQLRAALRKATLACRLTPVLPAAAYRHRGVQPLLDAIVDLLPAPSDRAAVRDTDPQRPDNVRCPDAQAPLAALAFKVVFDDFGQLTFVRIYSGELRKGQAVVAMRSGKQMRIGRLVRLFASHREEVDCLSTGDIGAIMGAPLSSGETIAAIDAPIALEAIDVPAPVMHVAIEPVSTSDRDKLGVALARLIAADPSLRLGTDDSGQTVLAGMGKLHLDVAVERLGSEHHVVVRAGRPRVAYRTTLARTVELSIKHAKQSGGPGQFAQIDVTLGPAPRGAGLVFDDHIRGGALPRCFIEAVKRGVTEAMHNGFAIAGADQLGKVPMVDLAVVLRDGALHAKDSSELAFHIAGSLALRQGADTAGLIVLEPISNLDVFCDEANLGNVVGDLARRRALVRGFAMAVAQQRTVHAELPLAESFDYASVLGSLTGGRGRFSSTLRGYQPVERRHIT